MLTFQGEINKHLPWGTWEWWASKLKASQIRKSAVIWIWRKDYCAHKTMEKWTNGGAEKNKLLTMVLNHAYPIRNIWGTYKRYLCSNCIPTFSNLIHLGHFTHWHLKKKGPYLTPTNRLNHCSRTCEIASHCCFSHPVLWMTWSPVPFIFLFKCHIHIQSVW